MKVVLNPNKTLSIRSENLAEALIMKDMIHKQPCVSDVVNEVEQKRCWIEIKFKD